MEISYIRGLVHPVYLEMVGFIVLHQCLRLQVGSKRYTLNKKFLCNRTSPIRVDVLIQVHWTCSHVQDLEQHSDLCQTGIYFHNQKVPKPLGGAANPSLYC